MTNCKGGLIEPTNCYAIPALVSDVLHNNNDNFICTLYIKFTIDTKKIAETWRDYRLLKITIEG